MKDNAVTLFFWARKSRALPLLKRQVLPKRGPGSVPHFRAPSVPQPEAEAVAGWRAERHDASHNPAVRHDDIGLAACLDVRRDMAPTADTPLTWLP